jgi:hypothetical protein
MVSRVPFYQVFFPAFLRAGLLQTFFSAPVDDHKLPAFDGSLPRKRLNLLENSAIVSGSASQPDRLRIADSRQTPFPARATGD